jgi:spermidine synthase
LASDFNLSKINLLTLKKKFKKLNFNLRYYTPELHFASKILPKYLEKKLK